MQKIVDSSGAHKWTINLPKIDTMNCDTQSEDQSNGSVVHGQNQTHKISCPAFFFSTYIEEEEDYYYLSYLTVFNFHFYFSCFLELCFFFIFYFP